MKCSLGISNFLEEISSLSHSVVFIYFFALIIEQCFLISPYYSLELCIKCLYLSFSPLPFTSLLFLSCFQGILRQPFSLFGFTLLRDGFDHCLLYNVSNSIHNSSGTLSIRSKPLNYLSLPLYNYKGFDLGHI